MPVLSQKEAPYEQQSSIRILKQGFPKIRQSRCAAVITIKNERPAVLAMKAIEIEVVQVAANERGPYFWSTIFSTAVMKISKVTNRRGKGGAKKDCKGES